MACMVSIFPKMFGTDSSPWNPVPSSSNAKKDRSFRTKRKGYYRCADRRGVMLMRECGNA